MAIFVEQNPGLFKEITDRSFFPSRSVFRYFVALLEDSEVRIFLARVFDKKTTTIARSGQFVAEYSAVHQ